MDFFLDSERFKIAGAIQTDYSTVIVSKGNGTVQLIAGDESAFNSHPYVLLTQEPCCLLDLLKDQVPVTFICRLLFYKITESKVYGSTTSFFICFFLMLFLDYLTLF